MLKEIAKAYEPSLHEDGIYKTWQDSGAFSPDSLKLAKDAKPYSIIMPPPNVTGVLHMGHAVMLALEDILTRYHRMKGERALWLPGTDHAAIATQTRVEKNLKEQGKSRHDLGREKFLIEVRKFAQESHDTIVDQVRKLGSSCDWPREAYTLDETRNKAVRSVFKLMYDDGLIYRGDRVVNWCPRCHSTLADDEVEHKQQIAKIYTFKYDKDFPLSIATTRPETKLGDTAVAVNPKDERYAHLIGQTLDAIFLGVPLKLKIIADRNVEMGFGTGALGVTPAHSMVDWQMAIDNGLPMVKVIDEDGKIHPGFGEFSNMPVNEARKLIIERLYEAGLIEKEEEATNNLSLCYRCGTPIEPLPSLQWFIDTEKQIARYGKSIKELSIAAVKEGVFGREKIRILPERFEKSYFNWMDNLRPWCISRQIWFGHQIPVWYKNDEIYVGVEAPTEEGWVQDEDTLDTWFSSGLWTFSTLAKTPDQIRIENGKLVIDTDDFRNFHPTAVLETGYDILFFWVARMIIMTTYALADIPFQDVYLHGLVLDEKGRKMSKSVGNTIDPLEMIKKYGTDATRMSLVIGSAPGNDMNLSEEKIGGQRNLVNKLWNICRFVATSYGFDRQTLEAGELGEVEVTAADNWVLAKLQGLIKEVSDDLDNYRFSPAAEKLRIFTWDDLADWYLEVSKFEKSETKQIILTHIISNLLKLWHPFMPFVTEAIWSSFAKATKDRRDMLMVQSWPTTVKYEGTDLSDAADFELVKDLIIAIRNARSENRIEVTKKIKAVIYAGENSGFIVTQAELIKGLRTGIEELTVVERGEKPEKAIFVTVGPIEIYLLGAIDENKERARLEKEIANLDKLVENMKVKLGNAEFVERAPAAIIEKERAKQTDWELELVKLKDQLKLI